VLWVEEVACEVVVVVVWLESNKGKWEKLVASFFCFLLRVQIFSRCFSVYSHEKSQDCLVYLYIGPHLPIFSSILIFSFLSFLSLIFFICLSFYFLISSYHYLLIVLYRESNSCYLFQSLFLYLLTVSILLYYFFNFSDSFKNFLFQHGVNN